MRPWPILLAVLLLSCSQEQSTITQDDLKSELKTTLSYAAMMNLLIGQHAQGSTPLTFDSVQAHYLSDQVSSELTSLRKKRPPTSIRGEYDVCVSALAEIERAASVLVQRPGDRLLRDSVATLTSALVPALTHAESQL